METYDCYYVLGLHDSNDWYYNERIERSLHRSSKSDSIDSDV